MPKIKIDDFDKAVAMRDAGLNVEIECYLVVEGEVVAEEGNGKKKKIRTFVTSDKTTYCLPPKPNPYQPGTKQAKSRDVLGRFYKGSGDSRTRSEITGTLIKELGFCEKEAVTVIANMRRDGVLVLESL